MNDLRSERRAERNAADLFTRACQTGDIEAFNGAVRRIDEIAGWPVAMRKFVRDVRAVSPGIQSSFQLFWTESKTFPGRAGEYRVLRDAVRLLLPKYSGVAVRLFRGTGAAERRRRIYGLSWSAKIEIAQKFALERRVMPGGSVLLETLAVPEAIISEIDYPQPFNKDEIRRTHPKAEFPVEFHEEREYIIDRRYLNSVSLVRRYEQSEPG
jgi:hypothetical protein